MTTNINKDNEVLNIAIEGRLDANTSPDFEAAVGQIPSDIIEVVIDLSNLDYIASSGLRSLLKILKTVKPNGGKVILVNPSDSIFEIFETTGFSDIFEVRK